MNMCTQCGRQSPIPQKGTLFIFGKLEINLPFLVPGPKHTYLCTYESHEQIINYISTIQSYDSSHSLRVGISTDASTLPLINHSLEELKTRVQHYDVITYIQDGDFTSFLQPIVDLTENEIYGFEHLLRPLGNADLSPGILFSTAQKAGMQSTLDQRAREEAIKARAQHIKPPLKSFINFLPSSIYNPEYCLRHTFEIVERYEVDPSSLVFEVVETEKITDVPHLKHVLDVYKQNGMQVALDDVGSGYATLDMLYKLQPNYVKIDRQYIQDCHENMEKQKFLTSVIDIASNLNIKVLGEGIEKKEEFEYCQEAGMDFAQGYYLGKPSPTPQLER
ncbi:EAL domain-containing protein [Bacillus tianshenii]|nr:EAL domain-containing protein [Bacillus tianshenii]